MTERNSFIFYRSFFEAINGLKKEDQLEIYKAIAEYSLNFNEPTFKGIKLTVWTLIVPQLKANNKKFVNGCKGAEHGVKGGRPKTPRKPQENPIETPNVNDNVNDNVVVLFTTPSERLNILCKTLNLTLEEIADLAQEFLPYSKPDNPPEEQYRHFLNWYRKRPKESELEKSDREFVKKAMDQAKKDGYAS